MQLQIHYLLVGSRPLETTCTVANTCTTKFSMVNHGTQVLTRVDLLVANLNLAMYTYRTKFSRTQAFVSNRDQIHVSNRIKSVLNLQAKNSQRTISLLIFCKKKLIFLSAGISNEYKRHAYYNVYVSNMVGRKIKISSGPF